MQGPHGLPPRINQEAIQAEFELCWQQLDELTTTDERRKQCKATLIDIEQRYVHAKIDITGFPLSKEELNSIKELKRNNNIVISRPDKGNGVVILNREDYVKKMNVILTDSNFEALGDADTNDRTLQQERALQAFLLRAC